MVRPAGIELSSKSIAIYGVAISMCRRVSPFVSLFLNVPYGRGFESLFSHTHGFF